MPTFSHAFHVGLALLFRLAGAPPPPPVRVPNSALNVEHGQFEPSLTSLSPLSPGTRGCLAAVTSSISSQGLPVTREVVCGQEAI